MNASTVFSPAMQRVSTLMLGVFQKFLMVAGLVFIVGLIGIQTGRLDLDGPLVQALLPASELDAEEVTVEGEEPVAESLAPRLRGAMDYVTVATRCRPRPCSPFSRRRRVSVASCISTRC